MQRFYPLLLLACFCMLGACSVSRKLSKVGIRDPASTQGDPHEISALRASFLANKQFAPICSKNWISVLQDAVMQRIELPKCSQALEESASLSEPYLKIEERSLVEQIHDSQCSTIARSQLDIPLQAFLASFESTGPLGRVGQLPVSTESSAAIAELKTLRDSLVALMQSYLPIERRMISSGEYLISESDLRVLNEITIKRECTLGDSNLEEVYQTISSLEDLASLLKNEAQVHTLQEVLQGLHKIVDNKITEYFSSK